MITQYPPTPADGKGSACDKRCYSVFTADIVSSTVSSSPTPVETASSMLFCCGDPAFDTGGVASELVFKRLQKVTSGIGILQPDAR